MGPQVTKFRYTGLHISLHRSLYKSFHLCSRDNPSLVSSLPHHPPFPFLPRTRILDDNRLCSTGFLPHRNSGPPDRRRRSSMDIAKDGSTSGLEEIEETGQLTYATIMATNKPDPRGPGYIKLYIMASLIFLCSTMNGKPSDHHRRSETMTTNMKVIKRL